MPVTDEQFFFQNYANGTLEHATLDLLFPVPAFITARKNFAGIEFANRATGRGDNLRVTDDGSFRIVVESS